MKPSETTIYRRWGKRALDVLLCAIALVLLAPLLAFIAVLVRVFLGAPILFRQTRSGIGQKPFTILKFRTMTDARDADGNLLGDTLRLTRLGRFLRATSFDELPELLNVFKGEMSLVGPRPLLPQYDAWYRPEELERFAVLPGITGWAQINGRNSLSWDDRFRHDVWYAQSLSLWLDLRILLRTVGKVLRREHVHVNTEGMVALMDEERRTRELSNQASACQSRQNAADGNVKITRDTVECF